MSKKEVIISYDIETSYTVGAVWGIWEQNVATTLREPYILSIAWKVLGKNKTHVRSLPDFKLYKKDKQSDRELCQFIKDNIFGKADVLIAHNGNSYDKKWIYGRFVINEITPPPPAKHIDTKLVAKRIGKFNSNSLKNLGKYFNLGSKLETGGIQLWVDCIEHDLKSAWKKMCKYNIQDVVLLEKVYLKMLPYMDNHPNINLMNGTTHNCPNCNSENTQRRGTHITRAATSQRYHCQDCGAWSQGNKILR